MVPEKKMEYTKLSKIIPRLINATDEMAADLEKKAREEQILLKVSNEKKIDKAIDKILKTIVAVSAAEFREKHGKKRQAGVQNDVSMINSDTMQQKTVKMPPQTDLLIYSATIPFKFSHNKTQPSVKRVEKTQPITELLPLKISKQELVDNGMNLVKKFLLHEDELLPSQLGRESAMKDVAPLFPIQSQRVFIRDQHLALSDNEEPKEESINPKEANSLNKRQQSNEMQETAPEVNSAASDNQQTKPKEESINQKEANSLNKRQQSNEMQETAHEVNSAASDNQQTKLKEESILLKEANSLNVRQQSNEMQETAPEVNSAASDNQQRKPKQESINPKEANSLDLRQQSNEMQETAPEVNSAVSDNQQRKPKEESINPKEANSLDLRQQSNEMQETGPEVNSAASENQQTKLKEASIHPKEANAHNVRQQSKEMQETAPEVNSAASDNQQTKLKEESIHPKEANSLDVRQQSNEMQETGPEVNSAASENQQTKPKEASIHLKEANSHNVRQQSKEMQETAPEVNSAASENQQTASNIQHISEKDQKSEKQNTYRITKLTSDALKNILCQQTTPKVILTDKEEDESEKEDEIKCAKLVIEVEETSRQQVQIIPLNETSKAETPERVSSKVTLGGVQFKKMLSKATEKNNLVVLKLPDESDDYDEFIPPVAHKNFAINANILKIEELDSVETEEPNGEAFETGEWFETASFNSNTEIFAEEAKMFAKMNSISSYELYSKCELPTKQASESLLPVCDFIPREEDCLSDIVSPIKRSKSSPRQSLSSDITDLENIRYLDQFYFADEFDDALKQKYSDTKEAIDKKVTEIKNRKVYEFVTDSGSSQHSFVRD